MWGYNRASVADAISRHNLTGSQQTQLSSIATRLFPHADNYANAIRVSDETVDAMAEMVSRGRGAKIEQLLKNMADTNAMSMAGFRFDKMGQALDETGATPFDLLIDAMTHIPVSDFDAYDKAFNQLAAANASNIRGIFVEAITFKRLKTEELDPDSPDSGLRVNPGGLRVGENVNTKKRRDVQGVDIESTLEPDELVSRSLTTSTANGRPLLVEVKNYTSNYPLDSLRKQTRKHFNSNIIGKNITGLGSARPRWKPSDQKPHLHYEWMGEGFVDANGNIRQDLLDNRKRAVREVCKKQISRPPLSRVRPRFNCDTDITFHVVTELVSPLTAR